MESKSKQSESRIYRYRKQKTGCQNGAGGEVDEMEEEMKNLKLQLYSK